MKALTIRQPWASLIIDGAKKIENRSKPTHYRGPLLIHAGKSKKLLRAVEPVVLWNADRATQDMVTDMRLSGDLPLGAIIGQVEVVDCVPNTDPRVKDDPYCDHTPGGWCWMLSKPRRFVEPLPASGSLSFFEVDAKTLPRLQATV